MPRLKHWVFDWLETIVVALILALIIRAFFLQVFWIPSGSMEPTLDVNDRIVVNKIIYHFREPRRFDIIVFRAVASMGEGKKDLIKRLIGLPGETIEGKKGEIFINGERLIENHSMNSEYYSNLITLPATFGPIKIPIDSYFAMGDNRPNSNDSRYWGVVPKNNLIGPAFLRIFKGKENMTWWEIPFQIRFDLISW